MKKKLVILEVILLIVVIIMVVIYMIKGTSDKESINQDILVEYTDIFENVSGIFLTKEGEIYTYEAPAREPDEEFFEVRTDPSKREKFVKSNAEYQSTISEQELESIKNLLENITNNVESEERLIMDYPSYELLKYDDDTFITIKKSAATEFAINKSEYTEELLNQLNKIGLIPSYFVEESNNN